MKIAFLFSGQGAQYPGMMKDIVSDNKAAKEIFEIADNSLGRSISELCFSGTQEELNLTHNTQPCVLAADLAAYAAITENEIKPDTVAGFSLGEYAALVAAGVIRIEDVFPVVQKRADYMQDAVPVGEGAMAAVMKLSEKEVRELCDSVEGYVVPANYNCPGQIVVSGENQAVDKLLELTKERKIRAMKLAVSAPFHCEMMNPAAENLRGPLNEIEFSVPSVPVYMNVDANAEEDPINIREKLLLQAKSPVRWEDTLKNMFEAGIDTFIELGPGKTLSGFVKKSFKEGVQVFNVTDLETLNSTIAAVKERI
jgi:[acyl-carrier-protein] S-malonyltransferase